MKDNEGQPYKFEVKITNPKAVENAPVYEISTVKEIFDIVNNENIGFFMRDFEILLRSVVLAKMLLKEGEPAMTVPCFQWIDDYERPKNKQP